MGGRWGGHRGRVGRLRLGGFQVQRVGVWMGWRENLGVLQVVVDGRREAWCRFRKRR